MGFILQLSHFRKEWHFHLPQLMCDVQVGLAMVSWRSLGLLRQGLCFPVNSGLILSVGFCLAAQGSAGLLTLKFSPPQGRAVGRLRTWTLLR